MLDGINAHLDSGETQVVRVVTEEIITDLMALPPEVRQQLIHDGGARIDLTIEVDKTLQRLELEAQA